MLYSGQRNKRENEKKANKVGELKKYLWVQLYTYLGDCLVSTLTVPSWDYVSIVFREI